MELVAETLKMVGRVDHVCVIHGGGLDEISPMGPAKIIEVRRMQCPHLLLCNDSS
jgi:anthranilate phosphoribosyltransferase